MDFTLRHSVQTGSGANLASYATGTGDITFGGGGRAAWGVKLTTHFHVVPG